MQNYTSSFIHFVSRVDEHVGTDLGWNCSFYRGRPTFSRYFLAFTKINLLLQPKSLFRNLFEAIYYLKLNFYIENKSIKLKTLFS